LLLQRSIVDMSTARRLAGWGVAGGTFKTSFRRPLAQQPTDFWKRKIASSLEYDDLTGGAIALIHRWCLIAVISSGPQRAIGDAPTAAMEAEGREGD
jgi:hypothetical protein